MSKTLVKSISVFIVLLLAISIVSPAEAKKKRKKNGQKIKILLVDGQSQSHKHWKEWTPILLKQLYDAERFQVDVATSPMKGESLDKFNPKFKNYDVVISTYDGDSWAQRTKRNLENYLAKGGGLVIVHAADNAFPGWEAYNRMIGVGGWGNRSESSGPYIYVDELGDVQRDLSAGKAGHHGPKHEFAVRIRQADHPIVKDLPQEWLHTKDELYDKLRGPGQNLTILATAFSDEKYEGSSKNEPVLMTINYEEGRVFHTTMGHNKEALACVGFMTTFVRGCEWAAGKEVTFNIPKDFPSEKSSSARNY